MATPLQRLCLQTRANPRILGSCTSISKPNLLVRHFHSTRHRNKRKAEEGVANLPDPNTRRTRENTPVNLSEIDAPRATSTHQLLEVLRRGGIEKLESEQGTDEYSTFLEQYGAAVSLKHPEGYDEFQQRHGFDRPDSMVGSSDKGQMNAQAKRKERMLEMTAKYLEAQNPLFVDNDIRGRKKEGFVSLGDIGEEHTGPDEVFAGDDITSLGHGFLEQHREIREFYRLAAWELPLLTQYAKPFELPSDSSPLRFRHTSYLGEQHPSERKVVVEFCTADLPLTPQQRQKLVKLLGQRYNPQKDMAKMSCESFADPLQNKRYLSDLIDTLLAEARQENDAEGAKDTFDDLPADFRHVKWKRRPKFPDAWKMTPDRRASLFQGWTAEVGRAQHALLEGTAVSGEKTITHYLGAQAVAAPQPVKVR